MRQMFILCTVICLIGIQAQGSDDYSAAQPPSPLIIHEWGTFTSLQDENGQALGGINTDEESVPDFVSGLVPNLLLKSSTSPFFTIDQGAPRAHPDVTMRLETPVIYFHLPKDGSDTVHVDVQVNFKQGWLTEYYPHGELTGENLPKGAHTPINAETMTTLKWTNLAVGGDAVGPATGNPVWLAPRAVKAASVTTKDGQSERFLFYRGVANLDAPLRVRRENDQFILHYQLDDLLASDKTIKSIIPFHVSKIWLVDIRADGAVAFQNGSLSAAGPNDILARISAVFEEGDYEPTNLAQLRSSMREAIIARGLYADEADALLNTWQVSYFRSPGQRLFFIVPSA